MYKIPTNYNIEKLRGAIVETISFSPNTIVISFGNNGLIAIEGFFSFSLDSKKNEYTELYPIKSDFRLLNLLGLAVTNLIINKNRNSLVITFDKNCELELNSNEMYESFKIKVKGNEQIII